MKHSHKKAGLFYSVVDRSMTTMLMMLLMPIAALVSAVKTAVKYVAYLKVVWTERVESIEEVICGCTREE